MGAFEEAVAVEVTTPKISTNSTTVQSVFMTKMPTQDVSTTELPMETESTSLSDTSTESTTSSVDHTIETGASTSGYVTSYELESTVAVEGNASSSNINENELFPDNLAHSTFPTPSSENLTETVYTIATEQLNLTDSPLLMEVNTTNSVLLESISPGLSVAATTDATTDATSVATSEVQSEAVTSNITKLSKIKNSLLPITTESKVSEEVSTETSAKTASVLATISPTLFDQRRGKKSVTATNRQTKLFKPSRSLEFVRFISDSLGSLKKRIKDVL